MSYDAARRLFVGEHHWAASVAGLFVVLMRERRVSFPRGARIAIASSVPAGKGVSSSAALETATMQAVSCAFGIPLEPRELALLCQKTENLVAGAPCGVMDQMTCVHWRKGCIAGVALSACRTAATGAGPGRHLALGTRFRRASRRRRLGLRRSAGRRVHGPSYRGRACRRLGLSGEHLSIRLRARVPSRAARRDVRRGVSRAAFRQRTIP